MDRQDKKTDIDIINNINRMIDKHVLHIGSDNVGLSSKTFCQSVNVDHNAIPLQGWKFHISVNNLDDYEKLMEKLCPEFDRLGIGFKVVRPEQLQNQMNGKQAGKAITIYPGPSFNVNDFSKELRDVLRQESIHPAGDAKIDGRIYARYGRFRGGNNTDMLVSQDGTLVEDPRHKSIAPDFVKETTVNQVLGFYSDCVRRYEETGDYKAYLQETATMTQVNDKSNAFVTLEVDKYNQRAIESALTLDRNENSFIFKINGQSYALIHNECADKILSKLDRNGVEYTRPWWDCRCNVYAIHPKDINNAMVMVNEFNDSRELGNRSLDMSIVPLDDGMYGIKVDTTMNNKFIDGCIEHSVRVREEFINVTEYELCQQRDSTDIEKKMEKDHEEIEFSGRR